MTCRDTWEEQAPQRTEQSPPGTPCTHQGLLVSAPPWVLVFSLISPNHTTSQIKTQKACDLRVPLLVKEIIVSSNHQALINEYKGQKQKSRGEQYNPHSKHLNAISQWCSVNPNAFALPRNPRNTGWAGYLYQRDSGDRKQLNARAAPSAHSLQLSVFNSASWEKENTLQPQNPPSPWLKPRAIHSFPGVADHSSDKKATSDQTWHLFLSCPCQICPGKWELGTLGKGGVSMTLVHAPYPIVKLYFTIKHEGFFIILFSFQLFIIKEPSQIFYRNPYYTWFCCT